MLRAWITALMFLTVLGRHALGQSLDPLPGGNSPAQRNHPTALLERIPPTQNDLAKHHMSPLGKPCLTIDGYAKPELVNKNIYQHWIETTNNCGQTIKLQICYYKTEHCVPATVPPYEKKDSMLGIFPALKRFQFEVKEQF